MHSLSQEMQQSFKISEFLHFIISLPCPPGDLGLHSFPAQLLTGAVILKVSQEEEEEQPRGKRLGRVT